MITQQGYCKLEAMICVRIISELRNFFNILQRKEDSPSLYHCTLSLHWQSIGNVTMRLGKNISDVVFNFEQCLNAPVDAQKFQKPKQMYYLPHTLYENSLKNICCLKLVDTHCKCSRPFSLRYAICIYHKIICIMILYVSYEMSSYVS